MKCYLKVLYRLLVVCMCQLGALSLEREGEDQKRFDGDLTFLGRVLAQLPVNLHLGKLVVLGHAFGCLEECLILGMCVTLVPPTGQMLQCAPSYPFHRVSHREGLGGPSVSCD